MARYPKIDPETVKLDPGPEPKSAASTQVSTANEIAAALVQAIELTRPVEKKNAFNRKINTPWTPKEGSVKHKLKRPFYQHGIQVDPDTLSNDEIDMINQLRPGLFLDGHVKVNRRKDRGIDIDYPVRTAAVRLKLINQFGVRNLTDLCRLCVEESKRPKVDIADLDDVD